MKKKSLWLLLFCLIFSGTFLLAGGIEDMNGLELKFIKIPFYKDQNLQMLIFSESGRRHERYILSTNTFLDILLKDADVDRIPDGWGESSRPYALNSPLTEILNFWRSRFDISDAVIFTTACSIDQTGELVTGEDNVYLRTPIFDLDGVGFRADFKRQIIEIDHDVRIVVRSSDLDPRKLLAGAPVPQNQRLITATSDRLRLDRKNNKIMLIGNVKIIDGRNTLSCDRLTVFMNQNGQSSQSPIPGGEDEKAILNGVSRILADGNVRLQQVPADPEKMAAEFQESHSEHLEYDVRRGIIILTGERELPTLRRGNDTRLSGRRIELLRHEDKMFVMQDCRIVSLVRDERGMPLYERVITSDRANFDGSSNVANFHGNVVAKDDSNTLYTDSLRAHLIQDQQGSGHKLDLLFGNGHVRIVSRFEKDDPDNPGQKVESTSTITSDQAELNYRSNKLIFYNNVKIRDAAATLDCDRLDIFLADRATGATHRHGVSGAPMAAGAEGKNKTVTKIIASGHVEMVSKGDKLNTDILTLFFRELPPGEQPSPGMIQSGGVQLIRIHCDGSVTATSQVEQDGQVLPRILRAANAMSDLLRDYSEFHGNVTVIDGNTEIRCRDMYIFTAPAPQLPGTAATPVPESSATAENLPIDDIDADPFAMDMGEDSVPTRIALTDTQDLKRIVCQKDVEILRKDKRGQLHRAGGDRAVYTTKTREIVLTAERPNRPWLRSNGRRQYCDIIRSDMATEDLRGIGNVVVMPDEN